MLTLQNKVSAGSLGSGGFQSKLVQMLTLNCHTLASSLGKEQCQAIQMLILYNMHQPILQNIDKHSLANMSHCLISPTVQLHDSDKPHNSFA